MNSSHFNLVRQLGKGAFGTVFQAIDPETGETIAIKFEDKTIRHPQLSKEAKIHYYLLQGTSSTDRGIPKMYSFKAEEKYNAMTMEVMGPSLEDLFNLCNRKFSLKTVLMLGEQMLSRIEFLHSKLILHRDIKPDNFVIGLEQQKHKVYIIDFGLSKKYIGHGGHIPCKEGKNLTGTARYASISTHLGVEQGRRDDLECLGYVMLYFLRGSLPWQNLKAKGKKDKYKAIAKKKIETTLDTLCKDLPEEFVIYLSYCRNLKFEDKPDYTFLGKLIRDLFGKSGFEWDYVYDWTIMANQRS